MASMCGGTALHRLFMGFVGYTMSMQHVGYTMSMQHVHVCPVPKAVGGYCACRVVKVGSLGRHCQHMHPSYPPMQPYPTHQYMCVNRACLHPHWFIPQQPCLCPLPLNCCCLQTLVRWRGVVVSGRDIDRVAQMHRENPAMPTIYHIFR